MTLLREAMLQAMKRKRSDESKVDAILDLLGLDGKNDIIVDAGDVAQIMAYANDAAERLDYLGEEPSGWESWDFDQLNKSMAALHGLLPSHLLKDEDE